MFIFRKKPKIILVLTGISFFASGLDCVGNNLLIIGVLSFFVAFLNFGASFFVNKYPFLIKISLLIINAVFAALSSYFYFVAGRDKIQYGWAVVSIIHVIVIIVACRKRIKSKNKDLQTAVNKKD